MAEDDRYRWLDRATAERLLNAESPEALSASADPEARDRAEQLAKTLDSLSVVIPPCGAELPGEAAALAAFRKAHPLPDPTTAASAQPSSDMGLVRVGRFGSYGVSRRSGARPARWGRPLHVGLGAALAAGMVGSVAMAAGIGVLPNPFDGDERGRPAATASAAEPRDPMQASPSPDGGTRGKRAPSFRPDTATGGGGGGSADRGSADRGAADRGAAGRDEPRAEPTDGGNRSRSEMSLPGDWRGGLASSCRDMRSGKKLEAERRRDLEKAAKGSRRVPKYCEHTLKDDPADRPPADTGAEGGQSDAGDQGNGGGNGQGNGSGSGKGHGDRAAARPTPGPTSFAAPRADEPPAEPAPDTGPTYGILPLPKAT